MKEYVDRLRQRPLADRPWTTIFCLGGCGCRIGGDILKRREGQTSAWRELEEEEEAAEYGGLIENAIGFHFLDTNSPDLVYHGHKFPPDRYPQSAHLLFGEELGGHGTSHDPARGKVAFDSAWGAGKIQPLIESSGPVTLVVGSLAKGTSRYCSPRLLRELKLAGKLVYGILIVPSWIREAGITLAEAQAALAEIESLQEEGIRTITVLNDAAFRDKNVLATNAIRSLNQPIADLALALTLIHLDPNGEWDLSDMMRCHAGGGELVVSSANYNPNNPYSLERAVTDLTLNHICAFQGGAGRTILALSGQRITTAQMANVAAQQARFISVAAHPPHGENNATGADLVQQAIRILCLPSPTEDNNLTMIHFGAPKRPQINIADEIRQLHWPQFNGFIPAPPPPRRQEPYAASSTPVARSEAPHLHEEIDGVSATPLTTETLPTITPNNSPAAEITPLVLAQTEERGARPDHPATTPAAASADDLISLAFKAYSRDDDQAFKEMVDLLDSGEMIPIEYLFAALPYLASPDPGREGTLKLPLSEDTRKRVIAILLSGDTLGEPIRVPGYSEKTFRWSDPAESWGSVLNGCKVKGISKEFVRGCLTFVTVFGTQAYRNENNEERLVMTFEKNLMVPSSNFRREPLPLDAPYQTLCEISKRSLSPPLDQKIKVRKQLVLLGGTQVLRSFETRTADSDGGLLRTARARLAGIREQFSKIP